ncbi:MAG: outer membrane beta-barrel protein [Bacteroidota bacterium]
MKSLRAVLLLLLLNATTATARRIDVAPMIGYFFDESFPTVQGSVKVNSGLFYGGILSVGTNMDALGVELQVMTRESGLEINRNDTISNLTMRSTWVSLNGCYDFDLDAPAMPFLDLGVGLVHLDPQQSSRASENRFALNVGVGIKVAFSDRVGLRLSTKLLTTMNESTAFENEDGQGAYTVNKMTYVTQFGFRGGVYIRLSE